LPRRRVAQADLQKRITVVERDMFRAAFPTGADCFLFVHQLVIWPPDVIRELMIKAFAALRPGGAVVIFSSISDDSQDGPLMAALDTAYFVSIPATRGMIYSWNDYETALRAAGFIDVERFPCRDWSPHGAVVAIKPESVAFAAGHDASVVVQSA